MDSNPTSAPPPIEPTAAGPEFYPGAIYRINIDTAPAELLNGSNQRTYRTRFTVGSSIFDPATPATVDELMRHADQDMYSARHAHRQLG